MESTNHQSEVITQTFSTDFDGDSNIVFPPKHETIHSPLSPRSTNDFSDAFITETISDFIYKNRVTVGLENRIALVMDLFSFMLDERCEAYIVAHSLFRNVALNTTDRLRKEMGPDGHNHVFIVFDAFEAKYGEISPCPNG